MKYSFPLLSLLFAMLILPVAGQIFVSPRSTGRVASKPLDRIGQYKVTVGPNNPSSGDPCSGCTNETFEGAGSVYSAWQWSGDAGEVTNVDYTTAPAPISGSQSLLLKSPAGGSAIGQLPVNGTVTECWVRWSMILTNFVPNNFRIFYVADNTAAPILDFNTSASGQLLCRSGTATATTTDVIPSNVVVYVWGHYLKNTGIDIQFGTSKTRPTSGTKYASATTGTANLNLGQWGPYVSDNNFTLATGIIFDDMSLSVTGQIGDVP